MSAAGRFDRQVRFAPLGREGQQRLERARVVLVGCGALGGALAQSLVRSGVGQLLLVDRDVVEESNLPRQVLFDQRHARESCGKAAAAAQTLARAGGPTQITALAAHVDGANVEELLAGAQLVLDGTDNLETRYLLNDVCVERGLPWIYGGVVGSGGLVLPVLPGRGPCLRCVFPEPPAPGVLPTCDSAGVLQPAVALVAALQAGLALRLLATGTAPTQLHDLDAWEGRARALDVARDPDCPCCGARDFRFLREARSCRALRLCGRQAVQVRPARQPPVLDQVARALDGLAQDLERHGGLLRFTLDGRRFTLFPDGRALIEGEDDLGRALALYDRYVGS